MCKCVRQALLSPSTHEPGNEASSKVSLKDDASRRQPGRTVRGCILTVQGAAVMLVATSEEAAGVWGRTSYLLHTCRLIRYPCTHAGGMSPALNWSSALQPFKCGRNSQLNNVQFLPGTVTVSLWLLLPSTDVMWAPHVHYHHLSQLTLPIIRRQHTCIYVQ